MHFGDRSKYSFRVKWLESENYSSRMKRRNLFKTKGKPTSGDGRRKRQVNTWRKKEPSSEVRVTINSHENLSLCPNR